MFCNLCKKSSDVDEFKKTFNEYKKELYKQNIYTINEYTENFRILHKEVKREGLLNLLNEIETFQKTVTEKTNDLMRFHIR
jgi:hypothetical protein